VGRGVEVEMDLAIAERVHRKGLQFCGRAVDISCFFG
jgi:hypothetical protein